MNATQIADRLNEIDREQAAIETKARDENGGTFTPEQRQRHDELGDEFRAINRKFAAMTSTRRTHPGSGAPYIGSDGGDLMTQQRMTPQKWVNVRTGEPVRTYAPTQRMSAAHETDDDLSVGRFMQAIATGNWRHAEAEKRVLNLAGNDTSGGHFLMPDELSSMVIDLARSASVLFSWGALTADMTSETLSIARVVTESRQRRAGATTIRDGSRPAPVIRRTVGTAGDAAGVATVDAPRVGGNHDAVLRRSGCRDDGGTALRRGLR